MQIKYIFLLSFLVGCIGWFTDLQAAEKSLSPNSQVILFTCGPGDELYAGFGHSALWIYDEETGVDRLYNYGTFDFQTPHFYQKFVRGRLDYMLSVTKGKYFLYEYQRRKISVYGQLLNLTQPEKQRFYEFLEENQQPENCFYRYDFFYDNCATRIRDALVKIADGEVQFNLPDQKTSLRKMLFPYLVQSPWTKLGINIILGLPADKRAVPNEYMYLPDYLMAGFESATIIKNGVRRNVVLSGREFLPNQLEFKRNPFLDPVIIFSGLMFILGLVSYFEIKRRKYFKWIDFLLMSIGIAAGVFILLLWFATDHYTLNNNLNFMWLIPAQAIFLFVITGKFKNRKKGARIALIFSLFILFLQLIWPQESEVSFFILTLIFTLRFFVYLWRQEKL